MFSISASEREDWACISTDVMRSFISVVHRVLCCRVLLNLRGAAREAASRSEDEDVSSIEFHDADVVIPRTDVEQTFADIERGGHSQTSPLKSIAS